MEGISQRSSTFVFELLDLNLDRIGTLDIALDKPPEIENNSNRSIKRTLSNVNMPRHQVRDVNMLSDRVRVSMILASGGQFPLGVFMFADASVQKSTGGDWVEATLADQGLMLDQGTAVCIMFPPGTLISQAIQERLNERLIHSVAIDQSSVTTKGDEWTVWPVGTSDLDILNDLCKMAGFYSIYFDNSGTAVARTIPDLAAVEPRFTYGPGTNVFNDTIVETTDLLSAPNRYIVVNNGMTETPISGMWDVPDSAPHSIKNRGMIVTKVIDSQAVSDTGQATAMARAIGQADTETYEFATFAAAINPLHDTFDVVLWNNKKYHEQSWSMMCLDGSDHKHELRRVYSEVTNLT